MLPQGISETDLPSHNGELEHLAWGLKRQRGLTPLEVASAMSASRSFLTPKRTWLMPLLGVSNHVAALNPTRGVPIHHYAKADRFPKYPAATFFGDRMLRCSEQPNVRFGGASLRWTCT